MELVPARCHRLSDAARRHDPAAHRLRRVLLPAPRRVVLAMARQSRSVARRRTLGGTDRAHVSFPWPRYVASRPQGTARRIRGWEDPERHKVSRRSDWRLEMSCVPDMKAADALAAAPLS